MKGMSYSLVLAVSLCFLLSPNLAPGQDPAPVPIAFEQFEYTGQDIFSPPTLQAGYYRNPILAGFHPDPSICRVGKDYYLINSTFEYFPGLPIFHSTDLVNWKQIGHIIHRPEQLNYTNRRISGGLFAPAITYHNGLFYVVCTMVDNLGNFVVTAENPTGPWSDPVRLNFAGIDPSIFFDDDGRAWIVNNDAPQGPPQYDGHRAIWIQEFDWKNLKMVGPRKMIIDGGVDLSKKPIWIEGPHIYKRNNWYYLCCAEGGTGPGHSQVIFRSRSVDGPYIPWNLNPILTQRHFDSEVLGAVTCTGHADLEIGPDGNWWAVFLAVRPYQRGLSPMGRETFLLPVKWTEDDWPLILPAEERVPLIAPSPRSAVVQPSSVPYNGSFVWRDEFKQKDLSFEWIMLRQPAKTWWQIDPAAGRLLLTPQEQTLSGSGNPTFLGRRVRHPVYSASVSVEIPRQDNVSAGLALFMNERHHYFLAVRRSAGRPHIFVECVKRGQTSRLAAEDLPQADRIQLQIHVNKTEAAFHYQLPGQPPQTLLDKADAAMISFSVPDALFLGATIGPHVRLEKPTPAVSVNRPAHNPIIWADVPDVAVIRVNDTYYMSSTTMHMSPGLPIMKSRDLVNWTLVGYAYDRLVENDAMNLQNGKNAYGAGSWASSLRFHNGTYYASTFSSTSGKTHIYTTRDIEKGPWKEISWAPSLHDHSLFFDDDGRVYMVYGAGDIRLVELEPDLSGIKKDGFHDIIIKNASAVAGPNIGLPAEGSQMLKINGKYYLMNITWPRGGMRTQIIHRADKITGPYEGKVILQDRGIAQGCLIDTPDGKWYAVLFEDNGAVGRSPWLVPVQWKDNWPVLGIDGKAPVVLDIEDTQEGLANLVCSDEFDRRPTEPLPLAWQWNHNPDPRYWSVGVREGHLRLTAGRVDREILQVRNMLTQRTFGPVCSATIKMDTSGMKDGDCAGLIALQKKYGFVGVKCQGNEKAIVMVSAQSDRPQTMETVPLQHEIVYLRIDCDFRNRTDKAFFYYSLDGTTWTRIGSVLQMAYTLPHFMGYRYGLFCWASQTPGGFADFDFFRISSQIME